MFNAIVEGAILGFTLAFLIGPVFFTLIQTSLSKGMNCGLLLAVGIALSDIVLIFLISAGVAEITNNLDFNFYLGIIGSIVLILFGINNIRKKNVAHKHKELNIHIKIKGSNSLLYILKGFVLNIVNPFVWIFWFTITVTIGAKNETTQNYILFFASAIVAVFGTDVLKCFIAQKIKNILSNKLLFIINKVVGFILVLFGLILMFTVLYNYY